MNSLLRHVALCGLLAFGPLLIAQTPPAAGSPGTSLPETAASAPKPKAQFSVDFPGGSVAELVAMLNQSDNTAFNLIGEPADQATRLPQFSLRNSDPAALALALNGFLRPRDLAVTLAGGNIFVLTKSAYPSRLTTPANANFQSFQLAPFLDTLSVEDITDAIRIAWEFEPGHDPKALRFKYHPATKLLFVYGPPEAIAFASQVIPQLKPNSYPPRSVADPAAESVRLADWQAEIERRKQHRAAQGQAAPVQPPPEKKK